MIVPFDISADMLDKCRQRIEKSAKYNNSHLKQKGKIWGFLSEEIISRILNVDIVDDFNYDILTPNNVRLEVKASRILPDVEIKNYFCCTVYDSSWHQQCDDYIFCRVKKDYTGGYILGGISKQDLDNNAIHYEKGSIEGSNKQEVLYGCRKIKIGYLRKNIWEYR